MSLVHAQHLDSTITYMEHKIWRGPGDKRNKLGKKNMCAFASTHHFLLPQQNQDDIGMMDSGSKQQDIEGGGTVDSSDYLLHSKRVHISAHHHHDCF